MFIKKWYLCLVLKLDGENSIQEPVEEKEEIKIDIDVEKENTDENRKKAEKEAMTIISVYRRNPSLLRAFFKTSDSDDEIHISEAKLYFLEKYEKKLEI